MLPFSPGRGLWKVGAQSATNAKPLTFAKHVDKVKVSRHRAPGYR